MKLQKWPKQKVNHLLTQTERAESLEIHGATSHGERDEVCGIKREVIK